jgi:MraZ protein
MFFMGTFTPRLDEKGRLFLPAKFRDRLAEGVVVTRGQEKCLVVWPEDVFAAEAARVMAQPRELRGTRDVTRSFFSGADSGTPDKQGRIAIPPLLRAYAGLEKDVAVIGVGDRIEIWDQARWLEYDAETAEKFSDLDAAPLPQ